MAGFELSSIEITSMTESPSITSDEYNTQETKSDDRENALESSEMIIVEESDEIDTNIVKLEAVDVELNGPTYSIFCELCDKGYSSNRNLKMHIKRAHTKQRDFSCNICEKCFVTNSDLTKHKMIHSDKKAFQCNICDKSFTYKSDLTRHSSVHLDVKAFECDMCPKSFKDVGTLRKHKVIHNGFKPFHCDMCDKSFRRRVELFNHHKHHTKYACNICSEAFMYKPDFNNHMKSHTMKSENVVIESEPFIPIEASENFSIKEEADFTEDTNLIKQEPDYDDNNIINNHSGEEINKLDENWIIDVKQEVQEEKCDINQHNFNT